MGLDQPVDELDAGVVKELALRAERPEDLS